MPTPPALPAFLEGLNTNQRKAVEAKDGPTLIIAGPGSGKTRVLISRVTYLLNVRNVFPWRIMAVTFTNKAAREMKDRLMRSEGVAEKANDVMIGTFHSICARILRREAVSAGLDRNFTIYDSDDQLNVVKAALAELNLDDKKYKPGSIHSAISSAKNELITPEAFEAGSYYNEIVKRVYERYQKVLQANNALDFDDLMTETVYLLRRNQAVREKLQERYTHVLVDEFQDTNIAQYELVKLMSGKHKNLFCVGDPDQCLPTGTLIRTPDGNRPIEKLRSGTSVVAASGRSAVMVSEIAHVEKRKYEGEVIHVKMRNGHELCATPNHMVFARLGVNANVHYVYLMHRRNLGYRVGIVKGVRSDGASSDPQLGLLVRSNQEVADQIWVLRVCQTREEAYYWESYFAFKYGIPTSVFHVRGRRMRITQVEVDRLFRDINTTERAEKLLDDLRFDVRFAHYIPKAKFRHTVNLRYFGDQRRTEQSPWNAHRISIISGDLVLRDRLEKMGIHTRKGKRNTWRAEFSRLHFDEAIQVAQMVSKAGGDLPIVSGAFLIESSDSKQPAKRFGLMPAAQLHPTMLMAIEQDGQIVADEIVSVERRPYHGHVYDFEVKELHNYVANGVVVHNSIYRWRGADYRNVLRLREDFTDLQTIALDQNYRSTQTILDAAMAVIKRNPNRQHIQLKTDKGHGPKIVVREMFNEDEEAQYVVDTIAELTRLKASEPGEVAVMYRTNAQSRAMEDAFVRSGLPYKLVGATRFYARKEVKDALAYLRIVNNPADTVSLGRIINVPARGIGEKSYAQIEATARANNIGPFEVLTQGNLSGRAAKALTEFATLWKRWVALKDELSVGQLFDEIIKTSGYKDWLKDGTDEGEDRWANVMELRNVATDAGDAPLSEFLNDVALVSETDNLEESANAPTLLTLHAAKGLEYKVVFMVGLVDGVLPHSRSLDNPDEMAEERRLMYVGITRAKERLYLLRPFRRSQWGQSDVAEPSRFLGDLPDELVDGKRKKNREVASDVTRWDGGDTSWNTDRTPIKETPRASGAEFKPGDRVLHAKFGEGMVLRSSRQRDDEEVEVFFEGVGGKRLSAQMSGLKKIK